jgi:Flp pilus assembly protein TadG
VRTIRDERGQALVEFALVLPVFALLLFAVIQFGIVFNNYITLTDAVRTGARTAAVSRYVADPAGASERAVRRAAVNLDTAALAVTVAAPSGWQRGRDVVVSATYPYEIDLLGLVVKSGRLASETTERIE